MSKGSNNTISISARMAKQQHARIFRAAKGLAGQPFVPYTGPMSSWFFTRSISCIWRDARQLYGGAMSYDPSISLIWFSRSWQAPHDCWDASRCLWWSYKLVGPVQRSYNSEGLLSADIAAISIIHTKNRLVNVRT